MKRCLAPLLLLLLLTGCTLHRLDNPPPDTRPVVLVNPVRVTIVGDSYTAGTNLGGQEGRGWPAVACGAVEKDPAFMVTSVVAAEDGAGYAKTGNYDHTFLQKASGVVSFNDNLVIVFGGRNDVGLPPDMVRASVHETVGQLRYTARNAKLLVIGPAWPGNPPPEVFEIRDIIRDESTVSYIGATFIDPLDEHWLSDPALLAADGIHPTDAGHAFIAAQIEPHMLELLTPSQTQVS